MPICTCIDLIEHHIRTNHLLQFHCNHTFHNLLVDGSSMHFWCIVHKFLLLYLVDKRIRQLRSRKLVLELDIHDTKPNINMVLY